MDLKNDREYASKTTNQFDSLQIDYNTYNEIFKKPNLPFATIVQNISQVKRTNLNIRFKSTTIKSLIANGETKLMDTELRNRITDYNANKEHMLDIYSINKSGAIDILKEISTDGGAVLALQRLNNQTELATILNIDNQLPLIYTKLKAYLGWQIDAQRKATDRLKHLIEEIDVCTELIQLEIEK